MRARGLLIAAAVASAAALAGSAGADVPAPRQISVDPFTNPSGQHETAVEPDSFAFGNTVVAVFQLGRIAAGGASGIGWARSTDGGRTWTSGVLPALTVHATPPGPYSRASDPVIAFDRVHGTWLASVLALREAAGTSISSLVTSRSADGSSWSAPVVTAPEQGQLFMHDKNWIVCDNGRSSPHAGRCYVTWTHSEGGTLAVSSSSDGGQTWSAAVTVPAARGTGWQPIVRPDGTLVVVYMTGGTIEAVRSRDGGRTFAAPAVVASQRFARVPGMRAPSLPSVEIDAAGRAVAAWHDCRFRVRCSTNDIVYASSRDGTRWTRVRRIRTAPRLGGLNHFVPGLAVDASTRGARTRLAAAFYVLTPRGCTLGSCLVQPWFVSSRDNGRTWSAPEALAPAQRPDAYPNSNGGRFAGDYISTSFTHGGTAVPVFAAASAPFDGRFHQGVFATAVPPLPAAARPLSLGRPRVAPRRPRPGRRVIVSAPLAGPSDDAHVRCSATRARVLRAGLAGGRAVCRLRVRAGARVRGTITVTTPDADATRRFALRVQRSQTGS
ncbi:MAG: exo-alpha-sialidase [Thermoleophilia bacterium]|nr:exo-alpha-sialidase [Thermoleophilia bacterium]